MRLIETSPKDTLNKHGKRIEDFTIENNIIKGVTIDYDIQNQTIGELLVEIFEQDPNYVAWFEPDSGKQITYGEMKESSIRLALWMRQQGLGSGDVITICSPNCLNNYIVLYATFFIGAVFSPWHYDLPLELLHNMLKQTKPKVIFTCNSTVDTINKATKLENHITHIVNFDSHPYEGSIENLINIQKKEDVEQFTVREIESPSSELATLLFSSGSSGPPKCVMMNYDRLLNAVLVFAEVIGKPNDVYLMSTPPYWVTGTIYMLATIFGKMKSVIGRKLDPQYMSQLIEKYQINVMSGSPTILAIICKNNVFKKSMSYSSGREFSVTVSGTRLSENLYNQFRNDFPHVKVYQGYGMSENGRTFMQTDKCMNWKSVGYIMPNTQAKVIDIETGKTLGTNQKGELCYKSTRMTSGYYNNPEATAALIDKDGWLHTGDLVYYNEIGELCMIDRIKSIIIYHGITVYSSEIEELLSSHPDVLEVCVTSYNIAAWDYGFAFVRKVPGSKVTEQELVELSATLGYYKKLWGGVQFVDEFPRTGVGKIALNALKEKAALYALNRKDCYT